MNLQEINMTLQEGIILGILTAIIGPIIVYYVRYKFFNKTSKIVDPIDDEIENSTIISDELEEIREKLNADRVWIGMFHNGGHYLHSMKSMQKYSIIHESCKTGVSSSGAIINNMSISLFTKSILHLKSGGTIGIPDVNDKNSLNYGLSSIMGAVGANATYSIGLFDMFDDRFIGIIGVDYLSPTELPMEDKTYLKERSLSIAGFLTNFIK
jgi:hypothetical protein